MNQHAPTVHRGSGRIRLLPGLGLAVVAIAALLVAGCSADLDEGRESVAVSTSEVSVDDDVFAPDVIEVPAGTEVTWTWVGSNNHNVTADEFTSETQSSGTFSHVFDQPGTYSYRCTLHPGMAGTVVVTDEAGGDAS